MSPVSLCELNCRWLSSEGLAIFPLSYNAVCAVTADAGVAGRPGLGIALLLLNKLLMVRMALAGIHILPHSVSPVRPCPVPHET